jgi:CopG family nickel-responsive transcriptional regulator
MENCIRFGISLPETLLTSFDADNQRRGYANRSEAIRDLIRNRLVEQEWEQGNQETAAAVVLVYDHHKGDVAEKLMAIQHDQHHLIVSTMHAHLDHNNCMEVILLRGPADELVALAHAMVSAKNVKHGRYVPATLGGEIA